jgi:type IV secretory pathway VirB10-like protein
LPPHGLSFKRARAHVFRAFTAAVSRQAAERLVKCGEVLRAAARASQGDGGGAPGVEDLQAQLEVIAQAEQHVQCVAGEADAHDAAKAKKKAPKPPTGKKGVAPPKPPPPLQLDAVTLTSPLNAPAWAAVRAAFKRRSAGSSN